MHLRHSKIAWLFKPLFWLLVIAVAVLSLLPADQLPPQALNIWDKAQHAVGFAVLTGAGLLAYAERLRALVVGLLVFGAAIECAQAITTWRYGDILDWVADAVGIAIVFIVAQLFARPTRPHA